MTFTWNKIMTLALFRSGLVGRAQIANANQINEAKDTLGLLMDELDGDGLALPNIDTSIKFDTVPGTAKYTFGTGGTGSAVRPETILTAILRMSPPTPETFKELAPMDFLDYTREPVPSTQAMPSNYAVNEAALLEVYFYPTPDAVYQITLNSKVEWAATLGDPETNYFAIANAPSGYPNALVDMLAHKLAMNNRLNTDDLTDKASNARFFIAGAVASQQPPVAGSGMRGIFGSDIIRAGSNP